MKIVSVRDKRVAALVADENLTSVKGLDALEVRKIAEIVAVLRTMIDTAPLLAVPSWRAHVLTGDRAGTWSLTVTRNWRLTFKVNVEAQEVSVLDYEDYH
jgi:proteic killer suppression protein